MGTHPNAGGRDEIRMKVLHVAESIWGGCGTYLNELLPLQFETFGATNVRLLVPKEHVSMLTNVAPEAIATFRRPSRALGLLRLPLRLAETIKRFRPDVIHAHSTFAGAVVRLSVKPWTQTPNVVYCPHGWVFDTAGNALTRRLMQAAERIQSRRCAAIVSISQAEKSAGEAAGIAADKLILIPNGLQPSNLTNRLAAWDDTRTKVLFVGRLDRQKGVDVLIEALRNLQDSVCARIVGTSVLSSDAGPQNLPNVEYLGWLDQEAVASQINACDVVVMPSRWEGFGLVAIEAMRAEKPVIASAVGGLPEIVLDGVTGRLFPVGDSGALARHLTSHTREKLAQMGRAGRDRFLSLYCIGKTHGQLVALYRAVGHRPRS